jgi:hypothetical protein
MALQVQINPEMVVVVVVAVVATYTVVQVVQRWVVTVEHILV